MWARAIVTLEVRPNLSRLPDGYWVSRTLSKTSRRRSISPNTVAEKHAPGWGTEKGAPANTPVPAGHASGPARAVRVADAIPRPADLPAAFKEVAAIVREYTADERAAVIWERAAEMVAESLRRSGLERLTLPLAAQESGYSVDHLRRLIDEGTIPNASVDGSKSILRMHLPRKPGHGVAPARPTVPSSRLQAARAVAGRED